MHCSAHLHLQWLCFPGLNSNSKQLIGYCRMYTRMETNTLAATLAVKPLPASSWACLTVRSVRPAALSSRLDRPCRLITNVGDLFRCSPFSSRYKNRFCGSRHGWTVLHLCRCKVSPLGTTNLGHCCQVYVNITQPSATRNMDPA